MDQAPFSLLRQTGAMTEQEAAAYAERLTRIWGTKTPVVVTRESETLGESAVPWLFCTHLTDGLRLDVYTSEHPPAIRLMRSLDGKKADDFLLFDWGIEEDELRPDERAMLPFFRRGCWLSGCPIEATAHEKAEWMKGFTREELEAWDLTM